MGTLVIEEYGAAGSGRQRDSQIPDLTTLLKTTVDSLTSTSAGTITLQDGTAIISCTGVEAHRVCYNTDTTTTAYAYLGAGITRDLGVRPEGKPIYYRTDA